MGREAECLCRWDGTEAKVKAFLESGELILRGDIRRRVPFAELRNLRVEGEELCFNVGGEPVSLALGSAAAARWLHAITSPLPTLAKKLGITSKISVKMIGPIDDEALSAAMQEAAPGNHPDLILARVDTPEALIAALQKASKLLLQGVPIWMIYPKGAGYELAESTVRDLIRANGMIDTKVCAVSPRLTALRFNKRKE